MPVYTGTCFCGEVGIEATGEPFAMGYCHCKDCRAWSAGPVNAFTLWQRDAVKVTKGADSLASFQKTEASHRKFCTKCGGHVFTDHPGGGFTDVYAATLPDLDFRPSLHINYASTVLRVKDGLPKYAGLPEQFGGKDEELPE
jgi:hypothetical protein